VPSARNKVAAQWEAEVQHYRNAGLLFAQEAQRKQFFADAEKALAALRGE
jgi:hypothetical protein